MNKPPVHIPGDLKTTADVFASASYQCWLVGGAVRDGLLNRDSEDYDLATDAEPEDVVKLFRRTIPTGIKHGTITILVGSHQFETTTFRKDGDYSDGRRPDKVSYSKNILDDLARRDFTINAIAWDLINNKLLDPHQGREDLKKRIIKAIGIPGERLREDGLRSIRACRFASQLGFSIHPGTVKAISENLANIPFISAERVWDELKKIFASEKPSTALNLFLDTGLMHILLPELAECEGVTQKGKHVLDVFNHSIKTCDLAERNNLPLRAAALFHDIGKPAVKNRKDSGEITFYRHEIIGAEITERILYRYKASNADRNRITGLVRHHMFHYTAEWTDAAVRRFMAGVGLDILDDLIALRMADAAAISPVTSISTDNLEELMGRVKGILEAESALSIGSLKVNGKDIIAYLGLKPGPVLGNILKYLLDCVIEDPECNEHIRLLDLAAGWYETYG